MTDHTFSHHREAALALLNNCPELPHKAAGFLGHVAVAPALSDPQSKWLNVLLKQKGFQPLDVGGVQ